MKQFNEWGSEGIAVIVAVSDKHAWHFHHHHHSLQPLSLSLSTILLLLSQPHFPFFSFPFSLSHFSFFSFPSHKQKKISKSFIFWFSLLISIVEIGSGFFFISILIFISRYSHRFKDFFFVCLFVCLFFWFFEYDPFETVLFVYELLWKWENLNMLFALFYDFERWVWSDSWIGLWLLNFTDLGRINSLLFCMIELNWAEFAWIYVKKKILFLPHGIEFRNFGICNM